MQAVILAGGLGTRLRPITGQIPKPLAIVAGRPLIDWHLERLSAGGLKDVMMLTGYGGDQIEHFCEDGSRWGLHIEYQREETALGTSGAVMQALGRLQSLILVTYADTVFDFDIRRMERYHHDRSANVTLFVHPNDHPFDSDLVETDAEESIVAFHPYPHPPNVDFQNLVNAGIYVIDTESLVRLGNSDLPPKADFGKHTFPLMLTRGYRLVAYRSPEYVKDAGTPERLARCAHDILSGKVKGMSLAKAVPAVFIDRDGTVVEEQGHISRPEQVRLLAGSGEALTLLNQSKYRTVMVTNQPVVARGECDEAGLRRIHNRLESLLGERHAFLDALYFCPHHPESGFSGERVDLKRECDCRKPETGLIHRAVTDLNLDLAESWMIGDTTTDVLTAHRSGVRSILVRTGKAGTDGRWPCLPDFECPDLQHAVDLILRVWPSIYALAAKQVGEIEGSGILLIGGLARSGKSTYAAAMSSALRNAGSQPVVIPIDSFLKGVNEDRGRTVLDRYDLCAVLQFVRDAVRHPGIYRLPKYDRHSRTSIKAAIEISIPEHPILILEGVPVLACADLRQLAMRRFYVRRNERDRLTAMRSDYVWRGWSEEQISALIESRGKDEVAIIEETAQWADAVIDSDASVSERRGQLDDSQ